MPSEAAGAIRRIHAQNRIHTMLLSVYEGFLQVSTIARLRGSVNLNSQ